MKKTIVNEIHRQEEERPDHPAIIHREGSAVSYAELWARIRDWERTFSSAGVEEGTLCGFICEQGVTYIAASLGLLAAGGTLVPVPEEHRNKTGSIYLQQLPLDVLIDQERSFKPRSVNEKSMNERPWDDLDMHPAYLRFTSGTTGDRKGVLLGHETIQERTRVANRTLQVTPDDRILWLLSMDHHLVVSIYLYLRNGATLVLPDRVLADPILSFAESCGTTMLYATPYHYRMLCGTEEKHALPDLRLAVSTADALPEETARSFDEMFNQPVSQALGIIEVGLPAVNLDAPREKPGSVGRVRPEYDVTLLGDRGEPVPEGKDQPGELHFDGPGLFDAYLHPWRVRQEVCNAHGFPTGDQAKIDQEGHLFLVGRRANRINRAGNKFFCEEVEEVLNRHPSVRASRVYGTTHPELGELPHAEVVPERKETPPSGSELKAHCERFLTTYKIPRSFEMVEELPRTPTGKIKRS